MPFIWYIWFQLQLSSIFVFSILFFCFLDHSYSFLITLCKASHIPNPYQYVLPNRSCSIALEENVFHYFSFITEAATSIIDNTKLRHPVFSRKLTYKSKLKYKYSMWSCIFIEEYYFHLTCSFSPLSFLYMVDIV